MTPAGLITRISELGGRIYLDAGELRLRAPKGSLSDELRTQITAQKQGLIDFLTAAESSASKAETVIGRANRTEPIPASFSQQRLWFLEGLEPGSATYNMPFAMSLKGNLDLPALQAAIDDVVARHESLHTRFESDGKSPLQIIDDSLRTEVAHEVRHNASKCETEQWLADKTAEPFDLLNGPLLRLHVLETGAHDYRLLIVVHHIVSDAWSMSILLQELSELYEAHCKGQTADLFELSLQYADYSVWQRNWLQGPELERQLGYWEKQLAGVPPLLELPTDRPRPPV